MTTKLAALLALLLITLAPSHSQDDCLSGSEALLNNTAVVSEFEGIVAAIDADLTDVNFKKFCTLGEGTVACQVNVGAYSMSYASTCQEEGGIVVTRDVKLTCSGEVQGIQIPSFEFDVFRVPICVDASCDIDNLPQEIDDTFDSVVADFVTQIESGVGSGVECDATTIGGDATSGGAAAGTALLATAVFGTTLLSWITQ